MNPTHEEALFAAALEQAPAERAAFLKGACLGDQPLRQRVEALLAAHDATANPLATRAGPARTIQIGFPDEPEDDAVGQTLGRYKLLEKVGEGGCGVVYVAEQTEPVRRRVALKVIKLGMDTRQVVARFEAERQALALMDHPNIAKVFDAGTTENGRPYFVMELVRGIRITDYCDQANLSTRDRLDLFIKVCHAIQHAHQKGIIHRDIKPSNILVTLHDGVPVPKVIDFGIAKATEGRLTDATVYTQLHQFIGTPAYMSPEQAEMSGLDIDTRSDIYSLGVLLYELLTGQTPFDPKELLSSGIDAMRKTIREKEPVRPSTRLTQALVAAEVTRRTSGSVEDSASSRRQLYELVNQIRLQHLGESCKALPDSPTPRALLATANVYAQRYQDYDIVVSQLIRQRETTPEDYLFKGQALCFDDWDAGLPLMDRAVAMKPSAMAHILRSESRVIRAWNSGKPADIEAALADVEAARAKSWSQQHLQLVLNSCQAHANAAVIYRRAGDSARWTNHLAAAEADGRRLEAFPRIPIAAVWRINQLEMAGRETGPDGCVAYMERLIQNEQMRSPLIHMRYGAALLRHGEPGRALEVLESVPADDWIDSLRLLAIVELPDRRRHFDAEFAKYRERYGGGIVDLYSPSFLLHAGRKSEARAQAVAYVANLPARAARFRPHYHRTAAFLAGQLPESEYVRSAAGILGDECETHCVVGLAHLADGDIPGAMEHLRKSADTSVWMWTTHSIARVVLAQLERHPDWPPK
jgi:serine/threonine protein kinase